MVCGRPRARPPTLSPSSMLRSSRHSQIPLCARGLPTWGTRFFPASSRRRRRSAPFTKPKSRSGGRSSRRRTSKRNEASRRWDFRETLMKLPRRNFLHLAAGAAALPAVSRVAWAQAYPTRTVRLIVGFVPGNPADIVARLTGQLLSERLGQPFVVENRPGASGFIGTKAVVRAPPDGYTLLVTVVNDVVGATLYDKLNYNFMRDIAQLAAIIRQPLVMVVHPSFPAKTVPEFIAHAKTNPGKVNMASAGTGTPPHLVGALFKAMAD